MNYTVAKLSDVLVFIRFRFVKLTKHLLIRTKLVNIEINITILGTYQRIAYNIQRL